MNNVLAPVSGKIVLKGTAKSSLNDRFTQVMSSNRHPAKVSNVVLSQASLKNQRLAEKMSARDGPKSNRVKSSPVVIQTSVKKSSRAPLKSRLGSISKSPKSRLGVVNRDTREGLTPLISPVIPYRLPGHRPSTGAASLRHTTTRPYVASRLQSSRNAQYGQSSARRPNVSFNARGRGTFHERGDGITHGFKKEQFILKVPGKVPSMKSKTDLDKELDDYMVQSAKNS